MLGHEKELMSSSVNQWAGADLNRRHTDFQSVALPTELPARKHKIILSKSAYSSKNEKKLIKCNIVIKKPQNIRFRAIKIQVNQIILLNSKPSG